MGSLNNGQHISKDDKVVRHVGRNIVMSTLSDDTKLTDKFELSLTGKLKQLEDSIKGMSSRVVWLDASDASTITTNGSNEVTLWNDKTSNGVYADDSDDNTRRPTYELNVIEVGGGITRNAIRFINDKNLSLGQQLDSEITGAGKSWTIIMALKPVDTFTNSNDFVGIINKFDDNDFSFYIYFFDDETASDPATFRTELYAGNSLSNGANIRGGTVDLKDKPTSMLVLTSVYDAAGGSNSERIDQYINREQDIASPFSYGTGMGHITNNGDPLTIGRYSGSDISGFGYSSFDGYFCELLIFNEPLSSTDRKIVEHYLGLKWGATSDMDDLRIGAG